MEVQSLVETVNTECNQYSIDNNYLMEQMATTSELKKL